MKWMQTLRALAAGLALDPAAPFSTHVRYASRFAALSTEQHGAAASMPTATAVHQRFPAQAV